MPKVLVLYYSSYGHIEAMAQAVAEGVTAAGGEPTIKRVPEIVPEDVARASGYKLDQAAEIATIHELPDYDAIIVGVGTRYGHMASQMSQFWDQTGPIWQKGALVGKVGAGFTGSATQHGGQETTLFAIITQLLHHGLVISGLPYAFSGQSNLDGIVGGSPYGASTVTGGALVPTQIDLDGARYLGGRVTELSAKLIA